MKHPEIRSFILETTALRRGHRTNSLYHENFARR